MKMRALAKSRAFVGSVVEMFEPPPPLMTQQQMDEGAGAPDSPHAQARALVDSLQWAALRENSPQRTSSSGSTAVLRENPPQRTSSSPTSAFYKQFACPKCGKSYQKEASLKFHLRYVLAPRCAGFQQQTVLKANAFLRHRLESCTGSLQNFGALRRKKHRRTHPEQKQPGAHATPQQDGEPGAPQQGRCNEITSPLENSH